MRDRTPDPVDDGRRQPTPREREIMHRMSLNRHYRSSKMPGLRKWKQDWHRGG